MFESIAQAFAPRQQQAAPTNAPPSAPGQLQQLNPGADPNKQVLPNGGSQNPPQESSPLDSFKDLWKNDPNVKVEGDPLAQPIFQPDAAKIREAASKVDFTQNIPPDLLQKALSGQDPQSLLQVINLVGQQGLAMSLQLGSTATTEAFRKHSERLDTALPSRFKNFQLQNTRSENPILNDPAVQPLVRVVRERVQATSPDATPQEIQAKVEAYFAGLNTSFNKSQEKPAPSMPNGETDFSSW